MPVVMVYGPPVPAPDELLVRLNVAVAEALSIAPRNVHAMFIPVYAAATGDLHTAAWPTALLHGRPRPSAAMTAASEAAARVLSAEWQRPVAECWVQWVLIAT
jgi:hypothetical protein